MRFFNVLILFVFFLSSSLFAEQQDAISLVKEEVNTFYSHLEKFLDYKVLNIPATDLILSLIIIVSTFVFRQIIIHFIFSLIHKSSKKTPHLYKKIIVRLEQPLAWFIVMFGIFLSVNILPASKNIDEFVLKVYRGASMITFAWAIVSLSDALMEELTRKLKGKESALTGFLPLIRRAVKVFIILVGGLVVIDNLGFDVTGALATLGIGGAAVAIASRDTVANLFGSLNIVLDRPFKIGDWIEVDNVVNGDVVGIGLRSTKIRTFMATIVSIPNGELANKAINNWSQMPKRRVKQTLCINYHTPADVLKLIVEDIRKMLGSHPEINQEFLLVNFTDFGQNALEILVYYFTKTTNWVQYLAVREDINLRMIKIVQSHGTAIALPSRTLYFGSNLSLNTKELGEDGLQSS